MAVTVQQGANQNVGRTGYSTSADPMLYDKVQKDKQRSHEAAMQSQALGARSQENRRQQQHEAGMQESSQEFNAGESDKNRRQESLMQANQLLDNEEDRKLRQTMQDERITEQKNYQQREFDRQNRVYKQGRRDDLTDEAARQQYVQKKERERATRNATKARLTQELLEKGKVDPETRAKYKIAQDNRREELETILTHNKGITQRYETSLSRSDNTTLGKDIDGIITSATNNRYSMEDLQKMDLGKLEELVAIGELTPQILAQLELALDTTMKRTEELYRETPKITDEDYEDNYEDFISPPSVEYKKQLDMAYALNDKLDQLGNSDNPEVAKRSKDASDIAYPDTKEMARLKIEKAWQDQLTDKPVDEEELQLMMEELYPWMKEIREGGETPVDEPFMPDSDYSELGYPDTGEVSEPDPFDTSDEDDYFEGGYIEGMPSRWTPTKEDWEKMSPKDRAIARKTRRAMSKSRTTKNRLRTKADREKSAMSRRRR